MGKREVPDDPAPPEFVRMVALLAASVSGISAIGGRLSADEVIARAEKMERYIRDGAAPK